MGEREDIARLIRDEAYPEFKLAPPPLWALRAADRVIAHFASATDEDYWERAIEAGTHRPAVDDFGNRYLASATDEYVDSLNARMHRLNAELLTASATDEGPTYWNQARQRIESARPAVPEALDDSIPMDELGLVTRGRAILREEGAVPELDMTLIKRVVDGWYGKGASGDDWDKMMYMLRVYVSDDQ